MTIEYDENGYVKHETLDEIEAPIFYGFLLQEASRHEADIKHIISTLKYLAKKFPDAIKEK